MRQIGSNFSRQGVELRIATPDLQPHGMPDLATTHGQQAVDAYVTEHTKLIIVDSITTLVRSGEENVGDTWVPVQTWALRQRADGRSVLFIHHSGKSGRQRGTSRREDVLDTVIHLKRPEDYSPEKGAVFEVHFEKSRGFYGLDAKPFLAQMEIDSHGRMTWTRQSLGKDPLDRVVALITEGKQQREIAAELGLSEARISQLVKQARDAGLFNGAEGKRGTP